MKLYKKQLFNNYFFIFYNSFLNKKINKIYNKINYQKLICLYIFIRKSFAIIPIVMLIYENFASLLN